MPSISCNYFLKLWIENRLCRHLDLAALDLAILDLTVLDLSLARRWRTRFISFIVSCRLPPARAGLFFIIDHLGSSDFS